MKNVNVGLVLKLQPQSCNELSPNLLMANNFYMALQQCLGLPIYLSKFLSDWQRPASIFYLPTWRIFFFFLALVQHSKSFFILSI